MGKQLKIKMRDLDIRSALALTLFQTHLEQPDTLIVNELGLCQGKARVDMAVINGTLNGFEIKSESDSLERLPEQQEIYNKTLDTVTVVANARHMQTLVETVPPWWGLWQAEPRGGTVSFSTVREPDENPELDPVAIAQLLWRDESIAALSKIGVEASTAGKPRRVLWQMLVELLSTDELRGVVRENLKTRDGWPSGPQPMLGDEMFPPCARS